MFTTAARLVLRRSLLAVGLVLCASLDVWADGQKDVLVLYATRPDASISLVGDRELPRLLEQGLGQRVSYYSEHLDLARFSDRRYQSAITDFLRLKYADRKFDLVIAMHEIVLDYLGGTRKQLFADTPVVFFSNTSSTARLPNSTGVITDVNLVATLSLATTLQPSVQNVYVVSGADARDKLFERRARAQFEKFDRRLQITYLAGLSTANLKARLSTLPRDSIVFYALVNRDGAGEAFHPIDYLADLAAISSAPVYSWVESAMGRGIVGGNLKSQHKQAAIVAEMALRVLRGESPDSIPTVSADLQVNQVDWRQIQQWGIDGYRLPAGTVVLHKEPPIWVRYKTYVMVAVTLVLAQTALITGLLVQRQRRRQAEEAVRGGQAKLQNSYDRIRKLGARLLKAQENERSRIARELHDDISQQLALLSIDLDWLRGTLSAESGVLAGQAWDRTQAIARSIHDLAYRLYPAKLRLIGLVPALQALQRETERSAIVMNMVHNSVPASLPPEVTLCVFRVVQEALQNALKYSGARVVSLWLEGTPNGLSVVIADDGGGFDVADAWGTGLGLVSMRERVEALNGTLHIESEKGAGTRLEFTLPLAEAEPVAAAG